jgi:hypothetical protein
MSSIGTLLHCLVARTTRPPHNWMTRVPAERAVGLAVPEHTTRTQYSMPRACVADWPRIPVLESGVRREATSVLPPRPACQMGSPWATFAGLELQSVVPIAGPDSRGPRQIRWRTAVPARLTRSTIPSAPPPETATKIPFAAPLHPASQRIGEARGLHAIHTLCDALDARHLASCILHLASCISHLASCIGHLAWTRVAKILESAA